MDKLFSIEDVAYVRSAIVSAGGKSDTEKEELAQKVAAVLTKLIRR